MSTPRVQTRIQLPSGGGPSIELPFVIGVLGDFSGRGEAAVSETERELAEASFHDLDPVDVDECLRVMRPRIAFEVPDTLNKGGTIRGDLVFERLADFRPDRLARQVPCLRSLLDARGRLQALVSNQAKPNLPEAFTGMLVESDLFRTLVTDTGTGAGATGERAPNTDSPTLQRSIERLDQALVAQLQPILHNPRLRALKGTWLGLAHLAHSVVAHSTPHPTKTLLRASDTDTTAPKIKIRVLDVSKQALGKILRGSRDERFPQSALSLEICWAPFVGAQAGDYPTWLFDPWFNSDAVQPFGLLVGDYYFDHSSRDCDILEGMARLAATAHAPFVAGVAPGLLGLDGWKDLGRPAQIAEALRSPAYAKWHSFRQSPDSSHVCLTLPRFLTRLPYGEGNPVDGLDLAEDLGDDPAELLPWANSAFAFAANVARSFAEHGWLAQISGRESGGRVERTPLWSHQTADGMMELSGPAEVTLAHDAIDAVTDLGLNALVNIQRSAVAVFFTANSLHQPRQYVKGYADASANEQFASMLPPLLCSDRFAHYVRCLLREHVGKCLRREELARFLNDWISCYVGRPASWARPLEEAKVVVDEVPGAPGTYQVVLFTRPRYQMERLRAEIQKIHGVSDLDGDVRQVFQVP